MRDRKQTLLITVFTLMGLAILPEASHWAVEIGLVDFAKVMRSEFLTGTAITVIAVLLYLLPTAEAPADNWPFE